MKTKPRFKTGSVVALVLLVAAYAFVMYTLIAYRDPPPTPSDTTVSKVNGWTCVTSMTDELAYCVKEKP